MDALRACFPAGTLSGAPKVRAMEIIEELEPARRGTYGGAVLYADFSGNLDSCIAIRSMLAKDGKGYVQAGAGIVADSVARVGTPRVAEQGAGRDPSDRASARELTVGEPPHANPRPLICAENAPKKWPIAAEEVRLLLSAAQLSLRTS